MSVKSNQAEAEGGGEKEDGGNDCAFFGFEVVTIVLARWKARVHPAWMTFSLHIVKGEEERVPCLCMKESSTTEI